MTLQQLRYFLAAVRFGSFTAAAAELGIAQPSLSEQVRRLEDHLGVELFHRVGRGLTLTEAGHSLRGHAERTVSSAEAAEDAVNSVRSVQGGRVAFGMFGTSRFYGVSALIEEFCLAHPAVRLRLVGRHSIENADAVRAGELEAALVMLPIDPERLQVQPIRREEVLYGSVVPERAARPVRIPELVDRPLILPYATWGYVDPSLRMLGERAQASGITLAPRLEVEDIEVAVDLAAAGLGDTVIDAWVLRGLRDFSTTAADRLHWVSFAPRLWTTFAVITRPGSTLSPASRAFLDLAVRRLQEQVSGPT